MTKDSATSNPSAPEEQVQRLAHPVRIGESSWPTDVTPLVSILCITYNHERFIRECLEGFLMQETTFPVEVLIHDDASADGTADIVREYEARFPNLIKPIYQAENQVSQKVKVNMTFNVPRAKGKYIALCEGDDYWTARDKLQTQIEFMESHPDYSACFHNVNYLYEDGSSMHPMYEKPLKKTLTIRDFLVANWISTPSNVYRARLFQYPAWFLRMPIGDWPVNLLNAEQGDIGYIDQIFAVYRVHPGGVFSGLSESKKWKINIQVAEAIDAHLGFKYTKVTKKHVAFGHYRIALNMDREGVDNGISAHLRSSMRNCFFHENIPKTIILRMLLKYSFPVLYMRLKQVRRVLPWRAQEFIRRILKYKD